MVAPADAFLAQEDGSMEVEKPPEPRHERRGNRCLVRDARFDLIGREQDLPAAADLSQMTPSRMSAKSFSRTVSQRRYHQTNRDRERDKLAIGLKREALSRTCRRPQRTRALLDPRDARSNQGAPGTARRDSQWLLPLALLRRGMTGPVGARCPEASWTLLGTSRLPAFSDSLRLVDRETNRCAVRRDFSMSMSG